MANASSPDIDGMGLVVDALSNSGLNRNIIRSGRILYTHTYVGRPISDDEFEKGLAEYTANVEDYYRKMPPRDDRERKLAEKNKSEVRSLYKELIRRRDSSEESCEILFVGVEPFEFSSERVTFRQEVDSASTRNQIRKVGNSGPSGGVVYLAKEDGKPEVTIDPSALAFSVNQFGRLRGNTFIDFGMLLCGGSRDIDVVRNLKFNPDVLRTLLDANKKAVSTTADKGVRIVGQDVYDTDSIPSVAKEVLFPATQNKIFSMPKMRIWIDETRGFIVPKLEVYESTQLANSMVASGFFLEPRSKLWWPSLYTETLYDVSTGLMIGTHTFVMNPENVELNLDIPLSSFTMDIEPQTSVVDRRQTKPIRYLSTEPITLEPRNGKLSLNDIQNLMKVPDPSPSSIDKRQGSVSLAVLLNVLLWGTVLCVLAWKRHRRTLR